MTFVVAHSDAGPVEISGTVVDATGQPVVGALVACVPVGFFDPSGSRFERTVSAADGRFRFAGVVGELGITAVIAGHTAAHAPASHGMRLQLGTTGRQLSGRVVDRSGRPLGGAEVRVVRRFQGDGQTFLTDSGADGRWRVVVPDGDYLVHAASASHAATQRALLTGTDSVELVADPVAPPGPAPAEAVAWMRAHAQPIATAEPGSELADLASLRDIVGNARVVGLGEVTHGTREVFQIKHRVLEYLVAELGFTVLAIETSLPESFAIDDYVRGGPGDPEQLLASQFVAVWQTEELRDVLRWMRDWNRTHARKVRFHGLDMRRGVHAATAVLAYLARVDPSAAKSAVMLLGPLADPVDSIAALRRPRPELARLAAQIADLAARLDSRRTPYIARSSAEAWWRAMMQTRVLAQSLEWRATGGSTVRQRAMADNAIRALEHHGPDARAIVWAHNAHIAGAVDAEPRMMGNHLRTRLGAAYRAIGSALAAGSYQAIDPSSGLLRDFAIAPAAPGSIEHTLGRVGHPLAILDLRSSPTGRVERAWIDSLIPMRSFDGLYDDDRPADWASPRTIVQRDYDALLFVATGSVARRLSSARDQFTSKPPEPAAPANLDLEQADGTRPASWLWFPGDEICGYAAALDRERPFAGRTSARIARTRRPRYTTCAGRLRQVVDALPHRGTQVRFRASVRVGRPGEHAHLYLESAGRRAEQRATTTGWQRISVVLDVPGDARSLELGLAFDGDGSAWIDDVSIAAR